MVTFNAKSQTFKQLRYSVRGPGPDFPGYGGCSAPANPI